MASAKELRRKHDDKGLEIRTQAPYGILLWDMSPDDRDQLLPGDYPVLEVALDDGIAWAERVATPSWLDDLGASRGTALCSWTGVAFQLQGDGATYQTASIGKRELLLARLRLDRSTEGLADAASELIFVDPEYYVDCLEEGVVTDDPQDPPVLIAPSPRDMARISVVLPDLSEADRARVHALFPELEAGEPEPHVPPVGSRRPPGIR